MRGDKRGCRNTQTVATGGRPVGRARRPRAWAREARAAPAGPPAGVQARAMPRGRLVSAGVSKWRPAASVHVALAVQRPTWAASRQAWGAGRAAGAAALTKPRPWDGPGGRGGGTVRVRWYVGGGVGPPPRPDRAPSRGRRFREERGDKSPRRRAAGRGVSRGARRDSGAPAPHARVAARRLGRVCFVGRGRRRLVNVRGHPRHGVRPGARPLRDAARRRRARAGESAGVLAKPGRAGALPRVRAWLETRVSFL